MKPKITMIDKNSIIYSLLTDRFDNDNSDLYKKRNSPDYEKSLRGYMGGTFNGIRNRIPYLKELGITHLMISPVEKCMPGDYHGYSTTHPLEINPHFGTPEDLKNLSKELREEGIGLILDYIPLTISNESKLFKEKSKTKKGREWFLFRESLTDPRYGEDAQRLVKKQKFEGSEYLHFFMSPNFPFLNLQNEEVLEWTSNRASELIKEYGFNDIRLDLGFYMNERVILNLKNKIKEKNSENIGVYTENWPDPLEEFNGGEFFGMCDGEFNLKGTILLNKFNLGKNSLENLVKHFYRTKGKSDLGYSFITGITNHDFPRFSGENYQRKILTSLLLTLPNFSPMIYYGTEIPLKNEGLDKRALSRGIMDFKKEEVFQFYKEVLKIRKKKNFENARLFNLELDNQRIIYTLNFGNNDNLNINLSLNPNNKEILFN